jgi:hydrogenase nickel incorporation protein HypA/HybF
MHEAGIAASILEIAEQEARRRPGAGVRVIKLRLGEMTGVDRSALDFAFECLRVGTLAEYAELEVERVPLSGVCDCGWTGVPQQTYCLACPQCQMPVTVLSGREMQVEYIEVDDVPCAAAAAS